MTRPSPNQLLQTPPTSTDDLIGKAAMIARIYSEKAKSTDSSAWKFLFHGKPGIGKSAVCGILARALTQHSSSIIHVSAAELKAEQIREWMVDAFSYRRTDWRVYWIEEVDSLSPAVQTLMLQFLDRASDYVAVLMTSNEELTGLSRRFQSRAQTVRFTPPSVEQVATFLREHWPELGEAVSEIAEANAGDVRASLNDAQTALTAITYAGSVHP